MRYIKYLEVENFKSFKRRDMFNFGNWKDLEYVLGRHPTGHSVVMDAMSFVLGCDSTKTRRLSDLIHRNEDENAIFVTAYVTLCCVTDDKGEMQFTRTISNNFHGSYQINGITVPKREYVEQLQVLGLNAVDRYCLVVEGAARLFSLKSREEQTEIFEIMNGSSSSELQKKYQRLISEISKCERKVSLEKINYYLVKFFHSEKYKSELEKGVKNNGLIQEFKENSNVKKIIELGQKQTALENIEKTVKKEELNIHYQRENLAKTKACLKVREGSVNSASEYHEELKSDISNRDSRIDQLHHSIEDLQVQLSQLKNENAMSDYDRLKHQAEKSLSNSFQKLKDLLKSKSTLQIDYDSAKSKLKDVETKLAQDKIDLKLYESNAMPGQKRKCLEVETETNKRFAKEKDTFANQNAVNVEHKQESLKNSIEHYQEIMPEYKALLKDLRDRMDRVNTVIAEVENDIKRIEEKIFERFCRSRSMKNIRDFEIDNFIRNKKNSMKKIELENEINKIKLRIDFVDSARFKCEESLVEAKNRLDSFEKDLLAISNKEKKQYEELNKAIREFEDIKKRQNVIKTEIVNLEREILDRNIKIVDMNARTKVAELEIEEIRKQHHQQLIRCKEQKVKLVFMNGNWDDVHYYANKFDGNYSKEDQITFDFSSLEPKLKQLNSKDVLGSNFEQLENLVKRVEKDGNSSASGRHDLKSLQLELKHVKSQRLQLFMKVFHHVNGCVDRIYKELTKCGNASATLFLEDADEPYFDGIKYEFAAPAKRRKPMSEMPYEERFVAASALLVAIQSFRNLPKENVENDEFNNELEQENIKKLSNLIQNKNQRDYMGRLRNLVDKA